MKNRYPFHMGSRLFIRALFSIIFIVFWTPMLWACDSALWTTLLDQGYVVCVNQKDKGARQAFTQIQADYEEKMVASMPVRTAIWIMHTPLIATPVVTDDTLTPDLISSTISTNQDLALSVLLKRATLVRRYLEKGGILIIAYAANEKADQQGRTPSQRRVFEKLKARYPDQVVDFPIEPQNLPGGKYPKDRVGATYFMHDMHDEIFEMTNLGVQMKDAHDGATWGVWQHNRAKPSPEVSKQLFEVVRFLEQANIRNAILPHSAKNAEKIIAFLDSYSSLNQGRPSEQG